jgi:hypothetical protein
MGTAAAAGCGSGWGSGGPAAAATCLKQAWYRATAFTVCPARLLQMPAFSDLKRCGGAVASHQSWLHASRSEVLAAAAMP